jgi:hypothetical protein
MNETMKSHLCEVRDSLIRSVQELTTHRVREIRELGISRDKRTPVTVLIRLMADEIRRISRLPEVGPIRNALADNDTHHE